MGQARDLQPVSSQYRMPIMGLNTFIAALLELVGGTGTSLGISTGERKGPVDKHDLWFFAQSWLAQEREADNDLRQNRYLDFADPASLATVLNAPPGGQYSHPFVESIRAVT
jgi:hypothetical protein